MTEYLVDVRSILDEIGGSVSISDSIDLPEIVVGDTRFEVVSEPTFQVTVSNAGEALVPIGTITARVAANCARCLCDFETDITGEIEGLWPRPGHDVPEDQDITGQVDEYGRIDLGPALIAALVVEAPFAPLHDPDCAGLCAGCGADLNVEECRCESTAAPDHPFAGLRDLLGDTDSDKDV